MMNPKDNNIYTDAETEARAEAALKRMLATPHKPHKEGKVSAGARSKGQPAR